MYVSLFQQAHVLRRHPFLFDTFWHISTYARHNFTIESTLENQRRTKKMKIEFYHVGGACFVLNIDDKVKIACDPALSLAGTEYQFKSFTSTRVKPPIYEDGLFDDVNLWLITHVHEDHIDQRGIGHISPASTVITHKKAAPMLGNHQRMWMAEWNESKTLTINGYQVEVTIVPAFHGNNFIMRKLIGSVNGYFLRISLGNTVRTVYVTSDTVYHARVVQTARKLGAVDLLIANLGEVLPDKFGGPITMSIPMLQKMVERLRPAKVIPIHINDFSHYTTVPEEVQRQGFPIIDQGRWVHVI
jgi:L-ascorbate metabolism protein UlaG (beta-lactamase superfamily)